MKLQFGEASFPAGVERWYTPSQLGCFMDAPLLSALFQDQWCSVLVTEGQNAMLHSFVPTEIGGTGFRDIEPWIGYGGPRFAGEDRDFARRALSLYGEWCREHRIVAELLRFDPLRPPGQLLGGIVRLQEGRRIAYVPLSQCGDEQQLGSYSPTCRRHIRHARQRGVETRQLSEAQEFRRLYHCSLQRVGASSRWFFDQPSFDHLMSAPAVSLFGAYEGGELVAGILAVADELVGYSLLVANGDLRRRRGAGHLLTHELIRTMAGQGRRWLCLGGGRSGRDDDSLLFFKAQFTGGHLLPLPLGFLVHDQLAVDDLNQRAAQEGLDGREIQPSGEILKNLMPYRLAPSLTNRQAIA